MSAFSPLTRYARVRQEFTEYAVYRDALLGEPLRCEVIDGPLDAPTWLPAGGMWGAVRYRCARSQQMTHRGDY